MQVNFFSHPFDALASYRLLYHIMDEYSFQSANHSFGHLKPMKKASFLQSDFNGNLKYKKYNVTQ